MEKDEKKEFEGHLKQKVRPDVEEGGAGADDSRSQDQSQ